MNQDKNSKTTRRDKLRLLRSGIQTHITATYTTVTIGGVAHKVADILSAIDEDIAKTDAAEKGHAAWLQLVSDERASHLAVDPIVSGVKTFVRLTFGNTEAQQATLADFGMTPRKKRVVKPKTKVAAAAKATATRALLHTMGSKQKAEAKANAATHSAQVSGPAAAGTAPATTVPTTTAQAAGAQAGAPTVPLVPSVPTGTSAASTETPPAKS
jgi:hypothetical protein